MVSTDDALAIFDQALELPAEQRAAFLDRACGPDAELRRKVESLLSHDAAMDEEFLRPPPANPDLDRFFKDSNPDELIGKTVGAYSLKRLIARGGMGAVYLAEQANPRREVALKLLHPGIASTGLLRRFAHESQILARLRHPHIAQVFEAGTHRLETGATLPFFAMEYVPEARTVTQFASERNLSLDERLALFAEVCDAVQHGHQRGIIHRDLKPGNILVDAAGAPKVIDFGVARSTDSDIAATTMQTDVGQLIGTLAYMSPEQCAADPHEIDTRSDVYSLGVVLYELLTGRLPYDVSHRTIHSAARIICEQPAASPSTFDRRLRGDLDAIVLKAVEKARERRYASAAALAEDIQRARQGEPISVRSPTAWARAARWVARHPVIATAAVCASFVATTMLSVWFLNFRPYAIEPGPGAREARLVSIGGRRLGKEAWRTRCPTGFAIAKLVDHKSTRGMQKLALLNFRADDDIKFAGRLCAFDAYSPDAPPVWARGIEAAELPQKARSCRAERFYCSRAFLEDVFDDPPGNEIVAQYRGPSSWNAVRIYDLEGNLLYQVWHDGDIHSILWLTEPKLLIIAAIDQFSNNDERARRKSSDPDPRVVFALRPERGRRSNDVLTYERRAGTFRVQWCLELMPIVVGEYLGRAGLAVGDSHDGSFDYTFSLGNTEAQFSWTLDRDGKPRKAGPDLNDAGKRTLLEQKRGTGKYSDLPRLDTLRLESRQ